MTFTYEKDDADSASKSVGAEVHKILSEEHPDVQVGEIISDYGDKYTAEIKSTLENNINRFESPFYIVVLHKKEHWAVNVMRNYFVARQTKPLGSVMWEKFPHHMHTVYEYNKSSCELKLLWSLPSHYEAKVVLQNWELYDPVLVKWCKDAMKERKKLIL